MRKLVGATVAMLVALVGCAVTPGEKSNGALGFGQWRPVQAIGSDRYLIQGRTTTDAITGGKAYCSKSEKTFDSIDVIPHTATNVATITFTCR